MLSLIRRSTAEYSRGFLPEAEGFVQFRFRVSNGKTGFIGILKNDVILRFFEGFRAGAQYGASQSTVFDRYIGTDFSGFNKPELAKGLAGELYKEGCDVIFHAAGASGLGVISAAVDTRKYVIGADMNQDSLARAVLSSMLKRGRSGR
jgi:basic membrane protein A